MGNKNSSKSSSNQNQLGDDFSYPQQQQISNFQGGDVEYPQLREQQGQKYNDDEKIEQNYRKQAEKSNGQKYDLEKGLSLEVKTMHKHFQFNKTQDQTVPIMVSIKTLDKTQEVVEKQEAKSNESSDRANIDLVCVIDHSGSMSGIKIENVKTTLKQLLDLLGENDRISLVLFDDRPTRLCPLMRSSKSNRPKLEKLIDSIAARGGTTINAGMEMALRVLKDRQFMNPVSSIFLLSDGQDSSAQVQVKNSIERHLPNECFTIHSFGFGNDHDAPLMNSICSLKDGNFYYVEKIDQVDEFFIDALGGLFSVVAQDILIDIKLNFTEKYSKFFAKSFVQKTFGEMWGVVQKDSAYQIKINQLLSGVSKDFIFEVTIPASTINSIEDFERNVEVISATASALPIDPTYTTKVTKDSHLVWTLFTNNEAVAADSEFNDNVEFNYLRVKASEAMDQAMKSAENQKYEDGQKILESMLNKFENSHQNNKERLQVIKRDLMECQQNSKPQVYEEKGRFKMLTKMNANIKQISQAVEAQDLYSNCIQREMVTKAKAKKGMFS